MFADVRAHLNALVGGEGAASEDEPACGGELLKEELEGPAPPAPPVRWERPKP